MREKFTPLEISSIPDPSDKLVAMGLNCLGSLYYFIKIGLKRRRLNGGLHRQMCEAFERQHIKDVHEEPRDHFKSTICAEGLPMWWALPVGNKHVDLFKKLGYSDDFITWMLLVHNPDVRVLLGSENSTNARKLGSRIRWHYESNSLYRSLFPGTLPTTQETWTDYSLHIRRPATGTGASHGEGTFDFLGVGGALQSRHYNKLVQDDLVGRKAIESPSIMDKTIEWHKLLVGAFESEDKNHENDELVVGNRWSYHDLNSHIREHETWFRFETHSALGGCCALHPADAPIFPEEFSFEKLMRLKARLGAYHFSCQFLNNPSAPEDADFKVEWLRYFSVKPGVPGSMVDRDTIMHEVYDGVLKKGLQYGHLSICLVTDPNHSGNAGMGRCRHSIVVVGMDGEGDYYLLDCWAAHASYDTYFDKIYEFADKWKLRKIGFETVAAQKYAAYHIDYRNKLQSRYLRIVELKGEVEAPDGTMSRRKEWRIRNVLSPIFEQGRFWIQRKHQDFVGEYQTFPRGRFCDILDALAYVPQMLKTPVSYETDLAWKTLNRRQSELVNRPYGVA